MPSAPRHAARTRKTCRRRAWRWALGGLIALLLFVYFVGPYILGFSAVCATNFGRKSIEPAAPSSAAAATYGIMHELRIPVGPPAATLSVWIIDPPATSAAAPPRATVLVLHGIHDNKLSIAGLGQRLADAGFRAVLIDLRGQGESTGNWLTYGVREAQDISQVLDCLSSEGLLSGPVGVFGPSYGGATALMLAGRDARVTAVVAVAPFSSMRSVARHYIQRYTVIGRLFGDAWADRAIDFGGRLAGFDPDEASPLEAIQHTGARILLLHGGADHKILPEHSAALARVAPPTCERRVLPDEDHDSIPRAPQVADETVRWFSRWLGDVVEHSEPY